MPSKAKRPKATKASAKIDSDSRPDPSKRPRLDINPDRGPLTDSGRATPKPVASRPGLGPTSGFNDPFSAEGAPRSESPVVKQAGVRTETTSHVPPVTAQAASSLTLAGGTGQKAVKISKATTDIIQGLKSAVAKTRAELDANAGETERNGVEIDNLWAMTEELDCAIRVGEDSLRGRVARLEEVVDKLQATVEEITPRLEHLSLLANSVGHLPEVSVPSEACNSVRKTRLQAMTRNAVYDMIGIDHKCPLPEPSRDEGCFWVEVEDIGTPGEVHRRLRPTWDRVYPNKVGWMKEIASKIQTDGLRWLSGMTAEQLASYSLSDIEAVVEAVWESLRDRYKLTKKSAAEKARKARKRRHEARKQQKLRQRAAARTKVPELADAAYDWFFSTTKYMSTDESGAEDELEDHDVPNAIDAETSEEECSAGKQKGAGSNARCAVTARPPTYRLAALGPLLQSLDEAILKGRRGKPSSHQFLTRIRGQPRDKELPSLAKVKNAIQIPDGMINPEWRARQNGIVESQGNSGDMVDVDEDAEPGTAGNEAGDEVGDETSDDEGEEEAAGTRTGSQSIPVDPALLADMAMM
ncbi:uncharacterized protein C8Q71DRAFT_859208 [Rhodofomes roseus]|uniref:Uncharacterized protein n=1 Tax=Rhodofomes roseus TaxID=34475 RepID=A0ABQ8KC11_9APHY|nr:uncharacterized protein C8Q71DRAFT_859208 [Rhodofomes roseus]KAH9834854.1 hypothetical protein C8Q71DRAFT_859208 [Rhodofomes roseus]